MRVPCILCSGKEHRLVFRAPPWKYYRCSGCGLVCLHPQPPASNILTAYDDYLPTDPKKIAAWKRMTAPVVRESCGLIRKEMRRDTGKLLDIGSGFGFFLNAMKGMGWEVEGIEISPTGRKYTRQQYGIRIHAATIEDRQLPAGGYDVITGFYVIEHLSDPISFLQGVYRLLKPGGMLLLRWPHTTPIVRLIGPLAKRFDLYHTPYHLYDFSPKTMMLLLNRTGFVHSTTVTGGYTKPPGAASFPSFVSAQISHWVNRITSGRKLLPGVSKTTMARKK